MSTIHWHSEPIVLRMAHAIARYIGFGDDEVVSRQQPVMDQSSSPSAPAPTRRLNLVATPKPAKQLAGHKWRRHPQLREYAPPIPDDVRSARHEAVRGLCAARSGAGDVAVRHFSLAARCKEVDLTAVPGFWTLTRGQMQMAVEAYERVGRTRDASALDAQIATIFRPSLVGAPLQLVIPRSSRQKAAIT